MHKKQKCRLWLPLTCFLRKKKKSYHSGILGNKCIHSPPSKGCAKGQQPQGWAGSQLILTASLSDVSRFFIHYSSAEWWVAGAGGGAAQLDFPQRFDTVPCVCVGLACTVRHTCRGKIRSIYFLYVHRKLAFWRNAVPSIEANCVIKGGKKPGVKAKLSGRAGWWILHLPGLNTTLYRSPLC